MYEVELYARIRRAVFVEGVSIREASRAFGVHRKTVRKMLAFPEPPGYRQTDGRSRPKLGPFVGVRTRRISARFSAGSAEWNRRSITSR